MSVTFLAQKEHDLVVKDRDDLFLFREYCQNKDSFSVYIQGEKDFYELFKQEVVFCDWEYECHIELDVNKDHLPAWKKEKRSFVSSLEFADKDAAVYDNKLVMLAEPVMGSILPSFEPDISFSQYLVNLIDEKGYQDPAVYKASNLDRKLFNHIINDDNYHPRKETAVALAIGLKLSLEETNELLEKAGYILSRSSKFDNIISYCIEEGIYDIFRINEILYHEDQKLLGC